MLLLTLVGWKYSTKPTLTLLFMLSAITAYFMNNYDVVIDQGMIRNIVQTNFSEAADLLSIKLLGYVLLLGLVPAVIVYKVTLVPTSWEKDILTKAKIVTCCVLVVLGLILLFSKFYASFFREHKPLRYYANPAYTLYSLGKYLNKTLTVTTASLQPLGQDALSGLQTTRDLPGLRCRRSATSSAGTRECWRVCRTTSMNSRRAIS